MKIGVRHLGKCIGSFLTFLSLAQCVYWVGADSVQALEGGAPVARSPLTQALRATVTTQLLTGSPFPQTGNSGTGISLTGERYLSDRFAAALNLAWRIFPGDQPMTQIGYGLILKHYLGSEGVRASSGLRLFLEYGLLLQIVTLANRPGSGTAHDTRLGLGTDFEAFGAPLIASASYHFSALRYFENPSVPLDYVGIEFGTRFSW